jgi:hypothetical protein
VPDEPLDHGRVDGQRAARGMLGLAATRSCSTAIGMLGVPLVDWVFMLRKIQRGFLGGFCPTASTILANLDRVGTTTERPGVLRACARRSWCSMPRGKHPGARAGLQPLVPLDRRGPRRRPSGATSCASRSRTSRSRSATRVILQPRVAVLPAGRADGLPRAAPTRSAARRRVKSSRGLKHKEFNPDGTYDAIAFCDTRTNSGNFDPTRPSERAFEMLLAVDYNGNGVRDAAEPIITFVSERYQDVGRGADDRYDSATQPHGQAPRTGSGTRASRTKTRASTGSPARRTTARATASSTTTPTSRTTTPSTRATCSSGCRRGTSSA